MICVTVERWGHERDACEGGATILASAIHAHKRYCNDSGPGSDAGSL